MIRQRLDKVKVKVVLLLLSMPILSLAGCANRQSESGGGFDVLAFLHNPIIVVIIMLVVVYYMMTHKK